HGLRGADARDEGVDDARVQRPEDRLLLALLARDRDHARDRAQVVRAETDDAAADAAGDRLPLEVEEEPEHVADRTRLAHRRHLGGGEAAYLDDRAVVA